MPWGIPVRSRSRFRMDGLVALDVAQFSMPESGSIQAYQPRHIQFDETGGSVQAEQIDSQIIPDLAYTGTQRSGRVDPDGTCSDWTSSTGEVSLLSAYMGIGMHDFFSGSCGRSRRLVCLKKDSTWSHDPLLRASVRYSRHAFLTSRSGTGDLSSWQDAGGNSQVAAGDAICQAHAARARLMFPQSYKAWLSTRHTDARDRFEFDGPWYRTDGVRIAKSMMDLTDGTLEAPIQLSAGGGLEVDFAWVWTGSTVLGTWNLDDCDNWSSSAIGVASSPGVSAFASLRWSQDPIGGLGCGMNSLRLYCLADNDHVHYGDFECTYPWCVARTTLGDH